MSRRRKSEKWWAAHSAKTEIGFECSRDSRVGHDVNEAAPARTCSPNTRRRRALRLHAFQGLFKAQARLRSDSPAVIFGARMQSTLAPDAFAALRGILRNRAAFKGLEPNGGH